ncbi:GNAT family N-acetyltransferase [Actibacterium pelagium]|uniref:N-acetyltransferase n=1 Tax=Actibacterium pelagium TaxID=2029103 RepID=A0A917EKL7_9RHOB|nr:GNAT family N-acetyltransferase [Actibacterium pelagium]GGE49592.1 N-acetyltransferase [Actibacterium pelagium]
MSLKIRVEHPLSSSSRTLIAASQSALEAVYSADECFSYSPEELDTPNSLFLVARTKGCPLGCVALVDEGDYGEVKRLYVEPDARGLGVARALLAELQQVAKDIGLSVLRLETGDKLEPAVKLYQRLGYEPRDRFGSYDDHPASLFMEKELEMAVY